MTQNRDIRATFGYKVDQASIQTVTLANTQVIKSLQAVGTQTLSVAQQLEAAGVDAQAIFDMTGQQITANVVAPMQAASVATQSLIRDIGDLGKDIQTIPEPPLSAFGVGGGVGGKLQKASQAAIALPGVGFQSPLVIGLRVAGLAADKTGASLLELGVAGGIVAVALAGVVIAFKDVTKSIDDAKKQLDGALAAQTNYYHAITELTSQQVRDQIATMEHGRPALVQQINETQNAIDDAFKQAQDKFGDAGARALDAAGQLPTTQLRVDLAKLQAQLIENDLSTVRYTQGLAAGVFALQNYIAEQKALTDAQIKAAQGDIAINNMTAAQRKEKADADMRDFAVLQSLIQNTDLTTAAAEALSVQAQALRVEAEKLNGTFMTAADIMKAVADAQQAITDQTDSYFAALKTEGQIRDDITKQLADEQTIRDDANTKAAQAQKDFYAADDRATEASDAKAEQAAIDNGERLAKIALDNADRIAKIERDYARSHEAAVGNRDALANYQAMQKRRDDLADQTEANQKAIDTQNAAYQKQQDQLTAALNAQYSAHYDAYQKQLESIRGSEAKQLEVKEDAIRQDQVDLQNAITAEQAIMATGSGGLRSILSGAWVDMLADANAFAINIGGVVGAALGNGGIGLPLGPPLPPYQETPGGSGTPFPSGQPLYGARGAIGFSAMQSGKSGGMNLNFAPKMQGATVEQMMTIATRQFVSMLRDAGYIA